MRNSLFLLFWLVFTQAYAQVDSLVLSKKETYTIHSITLLGNAKTKDFIILRELSIRVGDTISAENVDNVLQQERAKLINTDLFLRPGTSIEYKVREEQKIDIIVQVTEKWYLWPIPVLEIADRSVNEWLFNRDRDLSRINIGVDFTQNNFRGRNERLEFSLKTGFRSSYQVSYKVPFIDKERTIGMRISAFENRYDNPDVTITPQGFGTPFKDFQDSVDISDVNHRRARAHLNFSRRRKFYSSQGIQIGYRREQISNDLLALNPDYLTSGTASQDLLFFSYYVDYNNTNFTTYPTRGINGLAYLEQHGFKLLDDIAVTYLIGRVAKHTELTDKVSYSTGIRGFYSFQKDQGFLMARRFGHFGNIVRGYELYQGLAQRGGIQQNTLRIRAFEGDLKLPRFIPEQFRKIPLSIYPKLYVDAGYFWHPTTENSKINKPLLGFGFGADVISFYNSVVRLEWSVNIDDREIRWGPFFNFSVAL